MDGVKELFIFGIGRRFLLLVPIGLLLLGCGRRATPSCVGDCCPGTGSVLEAGDWAVLGGQPRHLLDSFAVCLERAAASVHGADPDRDFHRRFRCWSAVGDTLVGSPYWVEFRLLPSDAGHYHLEEFGGALTLYHNLGRSRYDPFSNHQVMVGADGIKLAGHGGDAASDGADFLRFGPGDVSGRWWNDDLQAMVTLKGKVALSHGDFVYHFLFSHGSCGPGNHRLEYSELFWHPVYGPVGLVFLQHDLGPQVALLVG